MDEKLFLVMPAYNEEANIEKTIHQWHQVVVRIGSSSRLIVFDDGSKDGTLQIMQKIKDKYPQFTPVSKKNSGHGATCIYAYLYSINEGAQFVFQTDSDGQTSPDEFWSFWEKRNEYDFIIGYRNNRQDGFFRKLVTKVLKSLVWFIFGTRVKDPNTPFRLMKAERVKLILNLIPHDFFLSNVMISTLAIKLKETVFWLPVSFKPRQGGKNSINLKRIIKIGIKAINDFYTLKKNIKHKKSLS